MKTFYHHSTVLAFAVASVTSIYSVQAEEPASLQIQQQGNVSYVTGGIGAEEREALEAMQQGYNVRIVSSEMSGAYLDATPVVIRDSAKHEVLNANAGPLFYAQLPVGRYKVESTNDGKTQQQDIVITKNSPPVRIHFSWKSDMAESSNQ